MDTSLAADKIIYPERDGKPMGETDVHVNEIADLLKMFQQRYRDNENVYVGANMLCYYEEGVPTSCFCPDVFIVFGVPKKSRRTFKLWEEAHPPTVVFEVSSRQSKLDDLGSKKVLYESLGVQEYFVYDPLGEYLRPPLQGFHLEGGEFQHMPLNGDDYLLSERLGLKVKLEKNELILIEATSGERLVRPRDETRLRENETQLRKQETRLREEESRRRKDAEAEVARLRGELDKLRKENGK